MHLGETLGTYLFYLMLWMITSTKLCTKNFLIQFDPVAAISVKICPVSCFMMCYWMERLRKYDLITMKLLVSVGFCIILIWFILPVYFLDHFDIQHHISESHQHQQNNLHIIPWGIFIQDTLKNMIFRPKLYTFQYVI